MGETLPRPTISVVIATYNNSDCLNSCLHSLARQVDPPLNFEVIVVDNGSRDDTRTVAADWTGPLPLRYRYHPKQASFETAVARNIGFKLARGEVVISLADDALVPNDFLRRHSDFHLNGQDACLVGARRFLQQPLPESVTLALLETGELADRSCEQDPHHHLLHVIPALWFQTRAPWVLGNWNHLSIRRDRLLALGYFDLWYSIYEEPDYELCYRLFRAGLRFRFDPTLVIYHLYHYRYPHARWRGRGFDYLPYKFRDRRVTIVSAALRFQEEIELRGDLSLSRAYQARLNTLSAAANSERSNDRPALTIGLLHANDPATEPETIASPNHVEILSVHEPSLTSRMDATQAELAAGMALARDKRSRELLQAGAAAQTMERFRHTQMRQLWEKAQTDLLVATEEDLNPATGWEEISLPTRPGSTCKDEKDSPIVQALKQEMEGVEGHPDIGPVSEGYSYPPRAISFKLTNLCNLRCRMCGQYGLAGNAFRQSPAELKAQMDLKNLQWIIDQVVPFRPGMIYLWGGEPFLHPAFTRFVDYIKQKKLFCIVTTNGTRLKATAQALVESRLDILRVSVDGPPEVHDYIRRVPGVFEQVVNGIQAINDAKRATGSSFPLFEIVCTISQDNYRYLADVASLFETMGISAITFVHQLYTPPDIGQCHQQFYTRLFGCEARSWQGFAQDVSGIDAAVLGQIIQDLEQRAGPVPIGFSPPLHGPEEVAAYYRNLNELFHDRRCSGPWLWLEVYPNGDIYPCHEFPDYRVGNILDEGFWNVWNSPRFRTFRRQLMLHRGFPGCVACRSQQLVDAFVV